MFAVVETGGKQYKVFEGSLIRVEKIDKKVGDVVELKPLIIFDDNNLIPTPSASSYTVKAKILRQGKGEKVSVFTYKNKTNHHRRLGHRQEFTELKIEQILGGN